MDVKDFWYDLPEELIAQDPLEKRDNSRLMVIHRDTGEIEHRHFHDVIEYLNPGDCLVINDTKVIPARLLGEKEGTGAAIEVLLLKDASERYTGEYNKNTENTSEEQSKTEIQDELSVKELSENEYTKSKTDNASTNKNTRIWECLVKPGKKMKPGARVCFGKDEKTGEPLLTAEVLDTVEEGNRIIRFEYEGIWEEVLDRLGEMPLPPYITHKLQDKNRYQTVYAKNTGSAAAPTAGLHFTEELLKDIEEKGIKIARLTLHVGLGTFRPVKVEKLEDHHMHTEYYELSKEAADIINETRKSGGRIISVGTTSTRTLETVGTQQGLVGIGREEQKKDHSETGVKTRTEGAGVGTRTEGAGVETRIEGAGVGTQTEESNILISEEKLPVQEITPASGWTNIFIYPGYEFKLVDSLITNFHLPESTLIMLVSAFYNRESVMDAYKEAVEERYRFFSFGDAMLLI